MTDWKTISEIVKNLAEVLGLAGGLWVVYTWRKERQDHSTEILFQLEDRFRTEDMRKARALIEDDQAYETLRKVLLEAVLPAASDQAGKPSKPRGESGSGKHPSLAQLDEVLSFYVLLFGVRQAQQVRDPALRACYRYWLAHYYSPQRRELQAYIDVYFPTLREWLREDARRPYPKRFFRPSDFGWKPATTAEPERIRKAASRRVLVITGSGISADSGIPTFRGRGGYWRRQQPEKMATREAFAAHPQKVWNWYLSRRETVQRAQPNAAHRRLAKLSRAAGFLLVTQNVDDLHERAETPADNLVKIHGSILETWCSVCGHADRKSTRLNSSHIQKSRMPSSA